MTLVTLLYIYYAFLAVWLIVSLVALYHMLSFGMKSFMTYFVTFLFISVSSLILSSSFYYIGQVDWTAPIEILNFDYEFNVRQF